MRLFSLMALVSCASSGGHGSDASTRKGATSAGGTPGCPAPAVIAETASFCYTATGLTGCSDVQDFTFSTAVQSTSLFVDNGLTGGTVEVSAEAEAPGTGSGSYTFSPGDDTSSIALHLDAPDAFETGLGEQVTVDVHIVWGEAAGDFGVQWGASPACD